MIHVVAAAVIDPEGRILIAQRPQGKHLAGGWEFPGGKLEAGEGRREGLARELREELGIEICSGPHRPLRKVRHSYPDREILLESWMIREYFGEPRGLDGQNIRWCKQSELGQLPLLPADAPIIAALKLPDRLLSASTDDYSVGNLILGKMFGTGCSNLSDSLAAEQGGVDFIVMTSALPNQVLAELCQAVSVPVFAFGVDVHLAWELGATGVHQLRSLETLKRRCKSTLQTKTQGRRRNTTT